MKSNIGDLQRLKHIHDACLDIKRATSDLDEHRFAEDFLVRAAVCNFITIIGEAVSSLSDSFKAHHPHIDWKAARGMRNIIVHQYFGIDYNQVWNSVVNDIPVMQIEVENAIKEFE